jgi:hypothetical protein
MTYQIPPAADPAVDPATLAETPARRRLSRRSATRTDRPGRAEPRGWSEPHLLAGRGHAVLIIGGVLILAGALTDTLAFENTLALALPKDPLSTTWLLAIGATCMSLVAAGSAGVCLARYWRDRAVTAKLAVIVTTSFWVMLGLAMFLVRWLDSNAGGSADTIQKAPGGQSSPLLAMFFAAIYLISGACTMFEAERLYNPEFAAFGRLAEQYRDQAALTAKAEAELERARLAVDHHEGELDREDERRLAAIADRQALGAEAANYARHLMATMMNDAAKTGISETGPTPELRTRPGAGDPGAGDPGAGDPGDGDPGARQLGAV